MAHVKEKAKYKCLKKKCGYKFTGKPGPVSCPKCGHLYIKWLNYKLWINNDL